VAATYLALVTPGLSTLSDVLVLPALVGEFWMVAHLLFSNGALHQARQSSTEAFLRA
jgi:hypothetical protein